MLVAGKNITSTHHSLFEQNQYPLQCWSWRLTDELAPREVPPLVWRLLPSTQRIPWYNNTTKQPELRGDDDDEDDDDDDPNHPHNHLHHHRHRVEGWVGVGGGGWHFITNICTTAICSFVFYNNIFHHVWTTNHLHSRFYDPGLSTDLSTLQARYAEQPHIRQSLHKMCHKVELFLFV